MKPLTDDQYLRVARIRSWAAHNGLPSLAEECQRLLWLDARPRTLRGRIARIVTECARILERSK